MVKYEIVIGLEIHLMLKTKSKLFCSCPNQEAKEPNINVCPICLGHPGVLPVINKEAVTKALKLGLALQGKIGGDSVFERKNYFYPDLPKGYQISQYQRPLVDGGKVETEKGTINLERIHLEEDTAKIIHTGGSSLLDFNRAGIPLLEIVTRPEIGSPDQARTFLEELQRIVRWLQISDADMEKGQFRCDSNISLRPCGKNELYPKTEVKNLNSFKAVENALNYEIKRQEKLWENNDPPKHQSTRGWDEGHGMTVVQRSKEEEKDYRYFPEPDLPMINVDSLKEQGINLENLKSFLPELPFDLRKHFREQYGFDSSQAKILTQNNVLAVYSKNVITSLNEYLEETESPQMEISLGIKKLLAKWLINNLLVLYKNSGEGELRIPPESFSGFLKTVWERKIPDLAGQEILKKMFTTGKDVEEILSEYEFRSDKSIEELEEIVQETIDNSQEIVEKIRQGKTNSIQYLIGQVMKKVQGRAVADIVRKTLEEKLKG